MTESGPNLWASLRKERENQLIDDFIKRAREAESPEAALGLVPEITLRPGAGSEEVQREIAERDRKNVWLPAVTAVRSAKTPEEARHVLESRLLDTNLGSGLFMSQEIPKVVGSELKVEEKKLKK